MREERDDPPSEPEQSQRSHPSLVITQNDKSALRGKCSRQTCGAYFTVFGPGLTRNPEAAMESLQRMFEKHFGQVHMPTKNT